MHISARPCQRRPKKKCTRRKRQPSILLPGGAGKGRGLATYQGKRRVTLLRFRHGTLPSALTRRPGTGQAGCGLLLPPLFPVCRRNSVLRLLEGLMEAARSQGSQPQGAPSLRRRVLGRDKSARRIIITLKPWFCLRTLSLFKMQNKQGQ